MRRGSDGADWRSALPTLPTLNRLAGRVTRSPGPLKIVAAQLTRHIDNFSDEEESRDALCFHRLGRQFSGRDAARGHFRFLEAFSPRRRDLESLNLSGNVR